MAKVTFKKGEIVKIKRVPHVEDQKAIILNPSEDVGDVNGIPYVHVWLLKDRYTFYWPNDNSSQHIVKIEDHVETRVIKRRRSDKFNFYIIKRGKRIFVTAGCRKFTLKEAIAHWSRSPEKWEFFSGDLDDREALNKESLKIIHKAVEQLKSV